MAVMPLLLVVVMATMAAARRLLAAPVLLLLLLLVIVGSVQSKRPWMGATGAPPLRWPPPPL